MSSDKSNQLLIREAIRKIALGRSMERINLAPGGMSGIGTARMIHGYVAKIHDNPSDEEFSDYGGTIDVGEYPDETASAEPVIHKGVLLSAATNSEGGFLIVPALFSDVTIFMDAATRYAYVVNFSHVDILRLNARTETVIGVTEMEELDPETTPPRTTTNWKPPVTRPPPAIRRLPSQQPSGMTRTRKRQPLSMRKASRIRWTSLKSDRQQIKWYKRSIPRPLPLPTTR